MQQNPGTSFENRPLLNKTQSVNNIIIILLSNFFFISFKLYKLVLWIVFHFEKKNSKMLRMKIRERILFKKILYRNATSNKSDDLINDRLRFGRKEINFHNFFYFLVVFFDMTLIVNVYCAIENRISTSTIKIERKMQIGKFFI